MDGEWLAMLVLSAVVIVGGLGYMFYYLNHSVFNSDGKGSAMKTRRRLQKFAAIRRFKVLGDITVTHGGKTAYAENMLVGFFGILLVHTLGARGEYYGTLEGDNWHVDLTGKRTTFPNPVRGQQKAMAVLRAVLSENKLYNIPIESIVVLTNRSNKTALFITHNGEILMPGKLGAYLDKTRFEKDIGLDVDKVVAAVSANRLQDGKA